MEIKNKTILITGASKGIGRAFAEKFAESNYLILIDKEEVHISANHSYYKVDLADRTALNVLIASLNKDFQNLDLLINVAGIGIYKNFTEFSDPEWDESLAVNVTAPYKLIKGLMPLLTNTNGSIVVNIGSGAGTMGMRGRAAYVTSKFALRGLSLTLSEEYPEGDPRVTLITLGSTITSFAGTNIEDKIKAKAEGRAYFTTEWVANKLAEILVDDTLKSEYVLYPGDYGFGEWHKP